MFKSKNFTFNGIENTDMGVLLVTLNTETLTSIGVPYSRNISTSVYNSNNPMFYVDDNEPDEILIELVYINQYNRPMAWTEDKLMEIQEWLITEKFAPFTEEYSEYTTYLMCTKIEQKMILPSMYGILECTFKPFSPYKYKIVSSTLTVSDDTKNFVIENPSFIPHRPIFKIINLGNEQTVNKINDLEITNLKYKEEITIDNLMATVINSDGENRFLCCNRSWIELPKGYTTLAITGNCVVEIMCEFAVLV